MNKPKTWAEALPQLKVATAIKDISDSAAGTRIAFLASTPVRDRDQEEIDSDGWHWKSGALPNQFYCHDTRSPEHWIGKGVRIEKSSDGLLYETELFDKSPSPMAEVARQVAWIARTHPDAMRCSVGFLPDEWIDPNGSKHSRENPGNSPPWSLPGRRYVRQELLENSVAPVPSNFEALQIAVRGMGAAGEWDDALIEQLAERLRKYFEPPKVEPPTSPWAGFFPPASAGASLSGANQDRQPA